MEELYYNDGFLRIEQKDDNTAFYCMPFDYNFLPLNIAMFLVKKLKNNMKHGYDMLDKYELIRKRG